MTLAETWTHGDTMNAAVLRDAGFLSVEDVPMPAPGAAEVLLRISGAGVCGSDASFYARGIRAFPPDKRGTWPVVPGHEFAGQVVARGRNVRGLDIGDTVACGAGVSCGQCRRCREGRTNLCTSYLTLGAHANGGLAQYCVAPASTCVDAGPHGVMGDDVALAQPMAVAHHAVSRGGVTGSDRVLVIGCGGVGAFVVWSAKQRQAEVCAADITDERLVVADRLGADWTLRADYADALADAQAGAGWDVIVETTGSRAALDLALAGARRGTRVVQLGLHKQEAALPLQHTTLNEIDMIGTYAHVCAVDIPAALGLLAARTVGWSDVAPTVVPLSQVVSSALTPMLEGTSPQIKTLIDPFITEPRPYRRDERAAL